MTKFFTIKLTKGKTLVVAAFIAACLGVVGYAPSANALHWPSGAGGKLYYYNGIQLIAYYGTAYPGVGWGYYNGIPYVSGWSQMPATERWTLFEGQWSKGGLTPTGTPWPIYHDVDAVWVPRCYWMQLDTQHPIGGFLRWQYWRWLPGGPEGRWFKLEGPKWAPDGRYRISDIHYDANACNAY